MPVSVQRRFCLSISRLSQKGRIHKSVTCGWQRGIMLPIYSFLVDGILIFILTQIYSIVHCIRLCERPEDCSHAQKGAMQIRSAVFRY